MNKKVLVLKGKGAYGSLEYFADLLHQSFVELGFQSSVLDLMENISDDEVAKIMHDETLDFTIGFNTNYLPFNNSPHYIFFNKKHISILVDHPAHHISYLNLKQPNLILACVDQAGCSYLHKLNFKQTFFLPHGGDQNIRDSQRDRDLDVVLLGTITDPQSIKTNWKEKLDPGIYKLLDNISNEVLKNIIDDYSVSMTSLIERKLNEFGIYIDDKKNETLSLIFIQETDRYIRSMLRIKVLKAIHSAKTFVFGNVSNKEMFKRQKNISFQPSTNISQSIEIMKRSKILLNISPPFLYGGHERIFNGMLAGCLVFTNKNLFIEKEFKDGKEVLCYEYRTLTNLNDRINYYLETPDESICISDAGKNTVLKNHTWKHRMKTLIDIVGEGEPYPVKK